MKKKQGFEALAGLASLLVQENQEEPTAPATAPATQETPAWESARLERPGVNAPEGTIIVGRYPKRHSKGAEFLYIWYPGLTEEDVEVAQAILLKETGYFTWFYKSKDDTLYQGDCGDNTYQVLKGGEGIPWEDRGYRDLRYTPPTAPLRFGTKGHYPSRVSDTLHTMSVRKEEDASVWVVEIRPDEYTPAEISSKEVEAHALGAISFFLWEISGDMDDYHWGKQTFSVKEKTVAAVTPHEGGWTARVHVTLDSNIPLWKSGSKDTGSSYDPDYGWMGNRTPW